MTLHHRQYCTTLTGGWNAEVAAALLKYLSWSTSRADRAEYSPGPGPLYTGRTPRHLVVRDTIDPYPFFEMESWLYSRVGPHACMR